MPALQNNPKKVAPRKNVLYAIAVPDPMDHFLRLMYVIAKVILPLFNFEWVSWT